MNGLKLGMEVFAARRGQLGKCALSEKSKLLWAINMHTKCEKQWKLATPCSMLLALAACST